jgi:hypothetical protein
MLKKFAGFKEKCYLCRRKQGKWLLKGGYRVENSRKMKELETGIWEPGTRCRKPKERGRGQLKRMMLKCSVHRKTIRSKREVVSSLGMEPLMARIRDDAKKKETVEALRTERPQLLPSFRLELTNSLPLICPGLEARKRRSGEMEMRYNGIVLLEVSDLDSRGVAEVKQKVAAWPTTLAAMTTSFDSQWRKNHPK